MGVLPACLPVHYICVWYSQRSEESVRSPSTEVTDSYEPHCWCWDPDGQPMLLIVEPSLQALASPLIVSPHCLIPGLFGFSTL